MRQTWILLTFSLLGFSLTGGSALAENKAKDDKLRERATAYWNAWRINDLHTVYSMEAGTVEGKYTPDVMRKSLYSALRLVDYKFIDVKVDGDTAKILLEMTMTRTELEGETFEAPRRLDSWTFTHDDWYHGALMDAPKSTSGNPPPTDTAQPDANK